MSGAQRPSLSVVVPCYRSPSTLSGLVDRVCEAIGDTVSEIEFVFVDDGSPDDTWLRLAEVQAADDRVRVMRLSRNYGQHNALLAGIRAASNDLVLTMDDDGQNPPDQVPLLLEAMTDDVDLVYGSPVEEQQTGFRNAASRLTKRMMRVGMGDAVNPKHSAFRLFRRRLIDAADAVRDPFVNLDVLLSWATVRQQVVDVRFDVRREGASGYDLRKLIRHAMNMITGFGILPLRLVAWLGFVLAIVGFLLSGWVLVRFVAFGSPVQGFTFLAAAINFFAGAQLLGIGIVGEYLGRVHFRSMGRPNYLVAERQGWSSEA